MEEMKQRSWWGRNWKWMLPLGCLGTLFLMIASCCVGIIGVVQGSIRYSWAYTEGVDLARRNKTVVELLGEPIETGLAVSGSINVWGSSGEAHLAIPLAGRQNKGTLYVLAHKRDGKWKFERAEVEVDGRRKKIDLLAKERPNVATSMRRFSLGNSRPSGPERSTARS